MKEFDEILDLYEPLVFRFVNAQKRTNQKVFKYMTEDELKQIGYIALWKTHENWNPDKGKFNTLFYTIVNNEMIMEIRRLSKYKPEEQSLNTKFLDKGFEEKESIDLIVSGYDVTSLEMKSALGQALNHFEEDEKKIISYKLLNYSNKEIADKIDSETTVVERKSRNLMKKFRKVFKHYYF